MSTQNKYINPQTGILNKGEQSTMEESIRNVKRNPYAKYHADEALLKKGIIYEDEDVQVIVTYAGTENHRYEKMLKLKLKPYETRIKNDNFSDEEFHKVLAEVYASTVVLGWKSKEAYLEVVDGEEVEKERWVDGIFNEQGDIVEFTEANVRMAFGLGQRLFSDVIKVATNFNLFRQGQKELDIKN